jgi:hypothetical protein
MREGIGQAFLFTLVGIIVGFIVILLISSMVYSKTYKIKTKLIDIIDKYDGDISSARYEIQQYLTDIGYRKNTNNYQSCPSKSGGTILNNNDIYHYCLYEFNTDSNKGKYYGALVYIYFDIPLVGHLLEFPVYGETEVFFEKLYIGG